MTDLKITRIAARAVNVPLKKPHPTAGGAVTSAPLVLIDLETDGGVTGHAYLFCYTALALAPVRTLVESIGALVTGDALSPFDLFQKMQGRFRLLGATGLTGMAIAGIDMAAWDASARAAKLPLARLLGGSLKPVPAYHSCGMGGVEGAVYDANESKSLGFSAIKFKIGYGDVADDIAAIRAAKKAAPNLAILVDYNQSLDVPQAIARCAALADEGLVWIEEPTTADDYAGHAKIAAASTTPIQIGENMWGVSDLGKAIAANASDYVMLDVMKIGGVTGWLRAAALAGAAGLRVSTHLFPEVSAHLQCVTQAAHWLEYQDWAAPILAEPLRVERGMAMARDEPGTGINWNETAAAKYAV